MRILGIDPGLHVCGYGCLENGGTTEKLVEAGFFRTNPKDVIEKRLNSIANDLEIILQKLKPTVVSVEQLYSHYAHPRTSILMGHARGVILQKCAQKKIEVKSYSATRVKKAVTGNGRATKEQVQKAVQVLMALEKLPEPNDVADAIAVALCCANEIQSQALIGQSE